MPIPLDEALEALTGTTVIGGNVEFEGSIKKSTATDWQIDGVLYTTLGGRCEQYINKTGAASVYGTLVKLSLTDDGAIATADISSLDHIGTVYSGGVADGETIWVVIEGDAEVLLEDGTAATRGYWVAPSESVSGRCVANVAAPSGGTLPQLVRHFEEVGHCRENVASGTDKTALVHLHFN